MFTGIVQDCGRLVAVDRRGGSVRLGVEPRSWPAAPPAAGDSVCVNGVCLTVVEAVGQGWAFDVVSETLARTTLGTLGVGARVNLEPALTPSTPLGGHFVQGHVDGIGRVVLVDGDDNERRIRIKPGSENLTEGMADLMEVMVPKGSVAIEGVSLTVAAVGDSYFEVALIPTTLQQTTLGALKVDDAVNLEADVITKTVVHWLGRQAGRGSTLTMDSLQRAGFLDK